VFDTRVSTGLKKRKENLMALPHKDQRMSVEEYFKLRESDPAHRYEYIDGEVYMMTGGSVRHSRVGMNLCAILENLLDASPCVVYNSDICFQIAEARYLCPDAVVSCDPRDSDESSDEEDLQTVQYPCFVAEVHSPGNIKVDLEEKLAFYQEYPSIQEFLFISTRAPKVRLYRRESNNRWIVYLLNFEDEIELTSLNVHFPVASLYKKTRFAQRNV
jgi:Uma2 family endonuclease